MNKIEDKYLAFIKQKLSKINKKETAPWKYV